MTALPPLLRLDHVSLMPRLGLQPILDDLSLDIQASDRIALIGPSGSGKTSLLRLLNRLNEASKGTIWFEGRDIRQLPSRQLRQHVTLVTQESKLLGMRVRDALQYPLQLRQFNSSEMQQRVSTWIDMLRIPSDWLDRTELELSVGQRQWVAIARSLITQPKVLLLDEPTSALDAGRVTHLISVLHQTSATTSMAIVMVNHQLDIAHDFSDRLLYLNAGRLIQDKASSTLDWTTLREDLIKTEQQDAEEWG